MDMGIETDMMLVITIPHGSDGSRGNKNSPLGLKQKSACLFWESGNPSIASNIFVDTTSIKIISAPTGS